MPTMTTPTVNGVRNGDGEPRVYVTLPPDGLLTTDEAIEIAERIKACATQIKREYEGQRVRRRMWWR